MLLKFITQFFTCQKRIREKVDRYVEFASKSTRQVASQSIQGNVSSTRETELDYHGNLAKILYTKSTNGVISLSTAIKYNTGGILMFMENEVIDGIPESILPFGEFPKDLINNERKLLNRYHQIIYYVVDSLLKRK